MTRTRWDNLPEAIKRCVYRHEGVLVAATSVQTGSAEVALVLDTQTQERVFLKGVQGVRARSEVRVQPFLPPCAPRLRWHATAENLLLMAFDFAPGRPAVLSPGSDDLPKIASALHSLSQTSCPNLPVLPAEKRWEPFEQDEHSLRLIRGGYLVHTDLTADNFIIGKQVHVVDWAWPTKGAPWLDTECVVARLIQAGHSPEAADEWAQQIPARRRTSIKERIVYAEIRANLARKRGAPILDAWETYLAWLRS